MKCSLLMFLLVGTKNIPAALPVLVFLGTRLWSSSKTVSTRERRNIFIATYY